MQRRQANCPNLMVVWASFSSSSSASLKKKASIRVSYACCNLPPPSQPQGSKEAKNYRFLFFLVHVMSLGSGVTLHRSESSSKPGGHTTRHGFAPRSRSFTAASRSPLSPYDIIRASGMRLSEHDTAAKRHTKT